MTNFSASEKRFQDRAIEPIHLDQLKRVEPSNGYAACRTQFLPFCL